MRLPVDGEEAGHIVGSARTGTAAIESIESEIQRMAPPLLYDLTELQRHANRLFGLSAQQTLDVAQALYERHKLISYPRTDSRHLSQDVAATLPRIVKAIAGPYQAHLAPGTGERPLGRRFAGSLGSQKGGPATPPRLEELQRHHFAASTTRRYVRSFMSSPLICNPPTRSAGSGGGSPVSAPHAARPETATGDPTHQESPTDLTP